jgi:hypothetical protein
MRSCAPGVTFAAVQAFGDGFVERLDDEAGFAAARTRRDTGEQAEWNFHIDIAQIVRARAENA